MLFVQRLTHEHAVCPILVMKKQNQGLAKIANLSKLKPLVEPIIKESDPIFGVLKQTRLISTQ